MVWYTNLLVGLAIVIIAHHYDKHPELTGVDRFYQVSDLLKPNSHEFWVNVCLIGAIYTYNL